MDYCIVTKALKQRTKEATTFFFEFEATASMLGIEAFYYLKKNSNLKVSIRKTCKKRKMLTNFVNFHHEQDENCHFDFVVFRCCLFESSSEGYLWSSQFSMAQSAWIGVFRQRRCHVYVSN